MTNPRTSCAPSRRLRRRLMLAAAGAAMLPATTVPAQQPAALGWAPIFDGRTVAGWKGAAQHGIEDGVLILRGGQASDALCTEQSFGDFVLRFRAHASSPASRAEVSFRARPSGDGRDASG